MIQRRKHRSRISEDHRVEIPAEILDDLGLRAGDEVEVIEEDGKILMGVPGDAIDRALGALWRADNPHFSDAEMQQVIHEAAEERATERYIRSLPNG